MLKEDTPSYTAHRPASLRSDHVDAWPAVITMPGPSDHDAVDGLITMRGMRKSNRRLTEDLRKAEIVIDVQKKVARLLEDLKSSSVVKEPR